MAKKVYPDGRVRDLKKEYASFHGQPEEIKKRAQRNAAHAAVEKKSGPIPKGMEVDHKKSLKKGGGNGADNLRVVSRETNRKKGSK